MVSFIAVAPSGNLTLFSRQPISYLNSPSCSPVVFVNNPLKRDHPLRSMTKQLKQKKVLSQFFFEFSGFVRKCKNWEVEGDPSLELEVLVFMKNSKKPQTFPSKKDLIDAGRVDLLDAIMEKGGWMTVGWEDDVGEKGISEDGSVSKIEECLEKNGHIGSKDDERSGSDGNGERTFEGNSLYGKISLATSSSGRSIELATKDESGIDGILNRLERQRNMSFGFKSEKNVTNVDKVNVDTDVHNQNKNIRKDVDSSHPQRSESASLSQGGHLISGNGLNRSYSDVVSMKKDAWRSWSIQRAGFSDTEFEAGEIDFGEKLKQDAMDKSGVIGAVTNDIEGAQDKNKDLDPNYKEITKGDLKTRLQHLEGELSSALRSLRSNPTDTSGKAREDLSKDLRQLSDVSEFQENEMMNSQDKLRTLRAKLAVLEGKMSLAILDAQNILDKKQKRINDARTALQLLRTTCIVWPNSGTEVLLAGSFDGWATPRKMARSSTGVFSLCLKLYPGKYEIKFIVDGVWQVDPLRPIVNNNGFENNLLTVT